MPDLRHGLTRGKSASRTADEELIEAKYLAAERLEVRPPDLVRHQPGWCDGIRTTLRAFPSPL